ncbi:Deleted in malignant brain tumors 1 protein [Trichoplax sp. H2]|nr:Deleted in malignant brain tumors 1 protein [Trichoplax sp. H2]|eukprot:RDD45646.1 Deleted in malignant brain tumors 1 protein [Trichoplax sp. H2]
MFMLQWLYGIIMSDSCDLWILSSGIVATNFYIFLSTAINGSDYPCSSNPCTVGRCISFQTSNGSSYFCNCPAGTSDPECFNKTTEFQGRGCSSNPCLNGGSCSELSNQTSYFCNCVTNFAGIHCESPNYCYPNPCKNSGLCLNTDGNFTCRCYENYQGRNCEKFYPADGSTTVINYLAATFIDNRIGRVCLTTTSHRSKTASVVCRAAGYLYTGESFMTSSFTYSGIITNPVCLGNETSLLACNYADYSPPHYRCYNQLFVRCSVSRTCNSSQNNECAKQSKLCKRTTNLPLSSLGYQCYCPRGFTSERCETSIEYPADGTLRIRNQDYSINSTAPGKIDTGIVEIFHKGIWGAVCNETSEQVAVTACKHLGYASGTYCSPGLCNNGTCKVLNNINSQSPYPYISCECFPGYLGNLCQYRNACYVNPCDHGGNCSVVQNVKYKCSCPYPWAGKQCQSGPYTPGSVAIYYFNTYGSYGQVRLYSTSGTRNLCKFGFTMSAAHAICQSNNFAGANSFSIGYATGSPSSFYSSSNPQCTGYETSLSQCPSFNFNGTERCSNAVISVDCSTNNYCASNPCHNNGTCFNMFYGFHCNCTGQYTGNVCHLNATPIATGSVRLVNSSIPMYGNPEIFLNNQWSTVCERKLTVNDMQVICRQLGYTFASAYFNQSDTNELPRYELRCSGNEASISECSYTLITDSSCMGGSVKIKCTVNPKDGDIRLASIDDIIDYEGFLQVFYNGTWGTVCRAKTPGFFPQQVCTMLGYSFSTGTTYSYQQSVDVLGPAILSKVVCRGTPPNLYECNSAGWNNVQPACKNHSEDLFIRCRTGYSTCSYSNEYNCRISNKYCKPTAFYPYYKCVCEAGYTGNECETKLVPQAESSIKLYNMYSTSPYVTSGNVLIYHRGIWGGFCYSNFSKIAGKILCNQLGYVGYLNHTSVGFGYTPFNKVWVTRLNCSGEESNITQCALTYEVDGYLCNKVRLHCSNTVCRPNYCIQGACTYNTSIVDGVTFYHQYCVCTPGYYGNRCERTAYCDSSPCMNGGDCINNYKIDQNISYYECQCPHRYYGRNCEKGPANNGDVSLIGPLLTSPVSLGRIRVYLQGDWYNICNENFTMSEANVVCQQLGYGKSNSSSNEYGAGLTGKVIRNLRCSGNELSIARCQYTLHNMTEVDLCNKRNVLGINCATGPAFEGDLRLQDGRKITEGRIEIYHNNQWNTICGSATSGNIGKAACNQLQYSYVQTVYNAYFGTGTASALILSSNCSVNATNTRNCTFRNVVSASSECNHGSDIGVICSSTSCEPYPCKNNGTCIAGGLDYYCRCPNRFTGRNCELVAEGVLRLVNGTTNSGNLEIYYNKEWKAVCDPGFMSQAAEVACKQLGFLGMKSYYCCSAFGISDNTFKLTDLNCNGDEARLIDCKSISLNSTCSPNNVAGVRCQDDPCASNPCYFGNTCTTISYGPDTYKFKCHCKPYRTGDRCQTCANQSVNSKVVILIFIKSFMTLAFKCHMNPCANNGTCRDTPTGIGCFCTDEFIGTYCTERAKNGDVRLETYYKNTNNIQGTVVIYQNGTWGAIAAKSRFKIQAANIVCRQLNYASAYYYDNDGLSGLLRRNAIYDGIKCIGNESSILLCNVSYCPPGQCANSNLVEVRCRVSACTGSVCVHGTCIRLQSKPYYRCKCPPSYTGEHCEIALTPGRATLVEGPNHYTGRLEVSYNGTSGGVCDQGFTEDEAKVACRQMGFLNVRSYWCCSRFGNARILLSNVTCKGFETSLYQCKHSLWNSSSTCSSQNSISLSCTGNLCQPGICPAGATCIEVGANNETSYVCQCPPNYYGQNCEIGPIASGAVRLNSQQYNQGTGLVQVFVNGKWGSFCNEGFTNQSGKVICRAMNKGKFIRQLSYNKDSNIGIFLYSNLQCKGTENSPIECPRSPPRTNYCQYYRSALVIECSDNYCDQLENPCNGHGTCNSSKSSTNYLCSCDRMYTGQYCETYVNPCHSNPCATQAGGRAVCISHQDNNHYFCECPKDFSGYNCLFYSKIIGIRVSGYRKYNQGLMEVYNGKTWGSTCYSQWKYSAAQVACRQLGFANAELLWESLRKTYNKNVTIAVGSFNCSGNEANLNQCAQNNEILNEGFNKCMPTSTQSDVSCTDKPLDTSLVNLTKLPANYTCRTEIPPCTSSPCNYPNATCVNVMKSSSGYTCLCGLGYWDGQICVNTIPVSAVTLTANMNVVKVGEKITLECTAYGRPRPTIAWLKNGASLMINANMSINNDNFSDIETKSVFAIKYAVTSDQGVYACQGTSIITTQPVTSSPQAISFDCSPKFCSNRGHCSLANNTQAPICSSCNNWYTGTNCEVIPPYVPLRSVMINSNTTNGYEIGQTVEMKCQITSYPMPSITWTKDNIALNIGDHYDSPQVLGNSVYYQLTSILVINGLTLNDIGNYQCKVHDKMFNRMLESRAISIEIDCSPQLCSNGGQCNFTDGKPVCSCGIPYTGSQCETSYNLSTPCSSEVCYGNGQCNPVNDVPICSCNQEYTGMQCESIYYVPPNSVILKSNTSNYIYGAKIALTCLAISRPKSELTWSKNGVPVVNSSNIVMIVSISPSHNTSIAESVLIFNSLTINDNGNYKCVGSYAPMGTIIQSSEITIKTECSSKFCNNNGVCSSTSASNLLQCNCHTYFTGVNCEQKLPNIVLSEVTILGNASTFNIGASVGLTCQAISRPISELVWTKDDIPISNDSNIMITYSIADSALTEAQSVLVINGLTLKNNGNYKCIGNYSLDYTLVESATIALVIILKFILKIQCYVEIGLNCWPGYCYNGGICSAVNSGSIKIQCSCDYYYTGSRCETKLPDIPLGAVKVKSNTATYIYGINVSLTCQAVSRPLSQLTWTKNGVLITDGSNMIVQYSFIHLAMSQSELILNNLKLADDGEYKCIGNYTAMGIIIRSTAVTIKMICSEGFCNGHGTCSNDTDSSLPKCSCELYYTGINCESRLPDIPLKSLTIQSNTTATNLVQGAYVALTCTAISRPISEIAWTSDFVDLIGGININFTYLTIPGNSTFAQSTLLFSGLKLYNNGNYRCKSQNDGAGSPIISFPFRLRMRCSPDFCNNNGACSPVSNGDKLTCSCNQRYTGRNCETKLPELTCSPEFCNEHGSCSNVGNSNTPQCSCDQSHTGIRCESELPEIYLSNVAVQSNTSNYEYGASVLLTCQAISRPVSILTWSKNGVPLANSSNIVIIPQSTSSSNRTLAQSVLSINKLESNGNYTCLGNYNGSIAVKSPTISIRNGNGICSSVTDSDLLQCSCDFGITGNHCESTLPKLPLNSVVAQANVSQYLIGSYVGLKCQAKARPRPKINWYHNGKQVIAGNRIKIFPVVANSNEVTSVVLAIRNLIPTDLGTYYCQAIDEISKITINSSTVNLQITCSPAFCNLQGQCYQTNSGPVCSCGPLYAGNNCENQLTPVPVAIQSISSNISQFMVGSYARLQCQAVGRPLPSITWIKNNITFAPGNTTNITNIVGDLKSKITSYLVFSPLSIGDNGAYSCLVHNPTSNQVLKTTLYEISFICSPQYCSNNGQCNMNNKKPSCSCSGGFGGDNCQGSIAQNVGSYVGIAIGCISATLVFIGIIIFLKKKGILHHKVLPCRNLQTSNPLEKSATKTTFVYSPSYEDPDYKTARENPSFGVQDKDL